jgi:hypothetical protein
MAAQPEIITAHIQRLTQAINLAYQAMRDERHRLAQWEAAQEFSILGELELLTTSLQGYAGQLINDRWEPSHETLTHLQQAKPFEIAPISAWYITDGDQYPQVSRYIELLDYLRLLLVEYSGQIASQIAA